MSLTISTNSAWGANASVNTILWGENFGHFGTNTPSTAGAGAGTTIWGGATIAYLQSSTNTKGYNEALAGGTAPELLLSKSNQTWSIGGIPTGGATEMTLSFLSNKTTFSVTTETANLTISGSQKSWTISVDEGKATPETFSLIIENTGSSNARIDDVVLKVKTAGSSDTPQPTVPVEQVQLNKSEITLEVDETETLTPTITPANATNTNVSWETSNAAVATIANGVITAVSAGDATITCKSVADPTKSTTCAVHVNFSPYTKSSLIFTAACGGSGTADDGATWAVISDGEESTYDATCGIHFGTNNKSVTYLQLATSGIEGEVAKVVVNARDAQANATISVAVGGVDFTCTNPVATNTSSDFSFTGSGSGEIIVRVDRGSSMTKAIYVKSIVVYYIAAPQKDPAGLAYADLSKLVKLGGAFTAPTLTNPNSLEVTYTSDNTTVAEVASNGAVTIKAVGKAVITASSEETENYKAGSASYTIYVTAHAGTEADPYTVADARLAIDCGAGVTGVYATGIVSEIVTPYNSQYGNISYNISTDGQTTSDQLQAFRGKAKDGEDFTSVDDVKVGDEVVVKGNLTKYNSTYEFAADNQLYSLTRNKEDAGLAYATSSYEVNVGALFATPELTNPHNLTVTYTSSDENLATVNASTGAVTIKDQIGTVTITASFDGNNSYLSGSASYSIIISDPSLTKVTFDATTDIAADNAEGVTKSGINIQTTHTDGVNDQSAPIAYYQTFKNQKLIVTSTVGNIKLIEFTTTGANYAASGFNGVTNNTWTGNTSSVELTASGNQVRMSKIDVYYKADNRTEAGLEWSTDAIELTVGDAFTAPTLNNPNGIAAGEITIASDNEDLATVSNGVVSLVANATGTATITATFEGNDDYKSATVNYTITVNAVGAVKNVVILAKYDGKWYALMNEVGSANNTLNALEVVYSESNSAILNLSAEEQAKIIWKRSIASDKATFKNGTNYITGTSGNTNLTLAANECEWTIDGEHYVIGTRTILYNKAGYFKNYAVSNVSGSDYSDYIVVLENPAFLTQTEIRGELIEGQWGTFCSAQEVKCPSGASFFTIAYANKQQNGVLTKVYFDEIGEDENLQAGKPYIYIANDNAIKGVLSGDAVAQGLNDNGFVGVLSDFDFQVNSDATRNKYYVIYGNQIRLCADGYFKLLAGRAYIDAKDANLPTREVAAPAPGRRRIGLDNPAAPQVLTDIEATQTTGKAVKMMIGEQLFILRDGKLYDTTGRFITNMQ